MEASRVDEERRKMYSELEAINHKQEQGVRSYGTDSLHQTASYLLLQALVLLSVSVSRAPCHLWWIHFSISLLVFFLFALTFTSTIVKYVGARLDLDYNVLGLQVIRASGGDEPRTRVIEPDKFRAYKLYVYVYVVLLALLAFTIIQLYACRHIPCDARN